MMWRSPESATTNMILKRPIGRFLIEEEFLSPTIRSSRPARSASSPAQGPSRPSKQSTSIPGSDVDPGNLLERSQSSTCRNSIDRSINKEPTPGSRSLGEVDEQPPQIPLSTSKSYDSVYSGYAISSRGGDTYERNYIRCGKIPPPRAISSTRSAQKSQSAYDPRKQRPVSPAATISCSLPQRSSEFDLRSGSLGSSRTALVEPTPRPRTSINSAATQFRGFRDRGNGTNDLNHSNTEFPENSGVVNSLSPGPAQPFGSGPSMNSDREPLPVPTDSCLSADRFLDDRLRPVASGRPEVPLQISRLQRAPGLKDLSDPEESVGRNCPVAHSNRTTRPVLGTRVFGQSGLDSPVGERFPRRHGRDQAPSPPAPNIPAYEGATPPSSLDCAAKDPENTFPKPGSNRPRTTSCFARKHLHPRSEIEKIPVNWTEEATYDPTLDSEAKTPKSSRDLWLMSSGNNSVRTERSDIPPPLPLFPPPDDSHRTPKREKSMAALDASFARWREGIVSPEEPILPVEPAGSGEEESPDVSSGGVTDARRMTPKERWALFPIDLRMLQTGSRYWFSAPEQAVLERYRCIEQSFVRPPSCHGYDILHIDHRPISSK